MYSTSELDELFQILNSEKGIKLNNHIGATQQYILYIAQIIRSSSADCIITDPTAFGKLGQFSCVYDEAADLHEKSLMQI